MRRRSVGGLGARVCGRAGRHSRLLGESQPRRNMWARGAYRREEALPPAFGSGRMRWRMQCRSDPLDVQRAGVNWRKSQGAFSRVGSINSKKTRKEHCGHYKESTERNGAHRFHRGLGFGWPATCTDGMRAHVAIFIRIVGLTKRLVSWILTQFPPNVCPECIL